MKLDPLSVNKTLEEAKALLAQEKGISPALRSLIELILLIVGLLINKGKLDSRNSSIPPSQDPNREKPPRQKGVKKPGGQNGHVGTTLEMVDNPDKIVSLVVDQTTLPVGVYKEIGIEKAQVVDIEINRVITEYQAQILEDSQGIRFTAPFPEGVRGKSIQYGASVKAHAVYMSQFQMLPYSRLEDYFSQQMGIPISAGSLFNFNKEAYARLDPFETMVKHALKGVPVLNADETGINVNSKLHWIHTTVSPLWAHFYIHKNRGVKAMDEEGVITGFKGVLVHDHLKAYYTYKGCTHALCNAHHLRELQAVVDLNGHVWAQRMRDLLIEINGTERNKDGILEAAQSEGFKVRYRQILADGDTESPAPAPPPEGQKKKRGKQKKEKHRNLLERLLNFEGDVLRFMETKGVPFTNNMAENDLRMIKVHQKISGCFRSTEGAEIFCRIRSYLLSAQKNTINPTDALWALFQGKLHTFCDAIRSQAE